MATTTRIGIVGAGTLGLTLALRMAERGAAVTVLEARDRPGGLSTWFDYGPFVWDQYYHVVLPDDVHLRALLTELGIAGQLRWAETKTGFLWQNRLLSMSNYREFLTFPALSLAQKLRLGAGIALVQRWYNPGRLDGRTAPEWLTAVFGHSVYARIWEPLLESKFGVLKARVPASIMAATIRRYADTRKAGGGRERMGYLAGGGMKVFLEALAQRIVTLGGTIHCGCRVEAIHDRAGAATRVLAGGQTYAFDRLISTLPTAHLHRIAPHLTALGPESSERPEFLGVIRLALVLRRRLSPYYIINRMEPGLPFTGIIDLSSLAGEEAFGGHGFVMLPRYDVPNSPWFAKPDAEVFESFLGGIERHWPDLRSEIVDWVVHREPFVQALWTSAPPPAAPRCTPDHRIWSVNAELAGRDTLNNNAIVKVAEDAVPACWAAMHTAAV